MFHIFMVVVYLSHKKVATTKAVHIMAKRYFNLHRKMTRTEVAYSCHVLLYYVLQQTSLIFVWDLSLIFQYHRMNVFIDFLCLKWTHITSCCILSFGWLPTVWILYANASVHCVYFTSIGGVSRRILPDYMEHTQCSETLAHKIRMLGNHPKERIEHSEHVESLKSR
jgi:hypothetical protein